MAVAEKRRAFKEWLQRRDRDSHDSYHTQSCGETGSVAKRMAGWRCVGCWKMIIREIKRCFVNW